jgi:hypothetical protein
MSEHNTRPAIDLELTDGAGWISRLVREFRVAVADGDLRVAASHLDMIQVAARHVQSYLDGRIKEG